MGSSSSEYTAPDYSAQTPSGFMTATPQPQPQSPIQYPSFLPDQPGVSATGLTPAHFAAIAAMDAPPPTPPPGGGATSPPAAGLDPAAVAAKREALVQAMTGAPMNRPGGRVPFNVETGAFERNPDWRPTNMAGMRASSPGYGGRSSYGGSLT